MYVTLWYIGELKKSIQYSDYYYSISIYNKIILK
jgi:hypothetical protein